jgi:hypothetical protein
MIVWGESLEDAEEYANTALDNSDLLTQDGVIGLELSDIEPDDEESTDDEEFDNFS